MKPSAFGQFAVAAALLVVACCASCNRTASTTPASRIAKLSPEDSLSEIMDVFRRRVEDTPIGFVAANPSGHSAMSGANKVSYELIRPAAAGEPYKAIVTVASQSRYSILRTVESSDEDGHETGAKDKSVRILDDTDPDAITLKPSKSDSDGEDRSKDKKGSMHQGEKTVDQKEDTEIRKYELVYQNGRWNLVTKLNEKTEKSIENAFNNALGMQI